MGWKSLDCDDEIGSAVVVVKLGGNFANGRIGVKDFAMKGRAFLKEAARVRNKRGQGSRDEEG